jgi:nucleolar complex protein 2
MDDDDDDDDDDEADSSGEVEEKIPVLTKDTLQKWQKALLEVRRNTFIL